MGGIGRPIVRLLAMADAPDDDDDLRLRKRIGVAAGILTVVAPVSLPIQAQGHPLSFLLAVALSAFSAGNLAVLAATRGFDRYIVALVAGGTVWVPLANMVGGGITGSSPGLVWAFLVPAYSILALGPRPAVPWFVAFLVSIGVMALTDGWARDTFGPAPYPLVVIGWVTNVILPLGIVFLLLRYSDLRRRAAEARADALLTNAIPAAIATRLKHGEERIAETYPETTVLFADIAGFTPWANHTAPDVVVGLLEDLFTRFDDVAADCGIEKLKTVGDEYMAVAGAPMARDDHADAALRAARGLLLESARWQEAHGLDLPIRVGLASGPVVGGVIGRQRILFDLWGDTVNTAARMQATGIPGRIQLSASTKERLSGGDRFESRLVEVKGLGPLTTYLLVPA
jgi:adenylate cyclase